MLKSLLLGNSDQDATPSGASQVAIFSYVWAAQSLVQLAFFKQWYEEGLVLGWIFFFLSMAVFVFPGRIRLFMAMMISGLAYYISQWPFVSNHIVADSIVAFTVVISFFVAFRKQLSLTAPIDQSNVEAWLSKFAPVVGVIFAFIYISIIISKLNHSFYEMDISCLTGMIQDAEANRPLVSPFLAFGSTEFFHWFFIIVEIALPVMLLFRQTRLAAFYFGVPFHILLGMMGHWSFSSFMIALYVLVCLPSLANTIRDYADRLDAVRAKRLPQLSLGVLFVLLNAFILLTAIVGKPSLTWLAWTLVIAALMIISVFREHVHRGILGGTGVTAFWVKAPGLVWIMVAIAVINSSGPYLGWKTQTSIAMYSNMRTEGPTNNHFFMPKIPLFTLQDDLVEIIDSNNPEVLALKTYEPTYGFEGEAFEVYRVYFEFRRFVAALEDDDLEITYIRNGETRTFRRGADSNIDADLDTPPAYVLHKLLYFRPVFKGEKAYCLH